MVVGARAASHTSAQVVALQQRETVDVPTSGHSAARATWADVSSSFDMVDMDTKMYCCRRLSRRQLFALSVRMRQAKVRLYYRRPRVQYTIAVLIGANFLTNIFEKQVDPRNILYPDVWAAVEFLWNLVFLAELSWNLYGSWYVTTLQDHFLRSGWNIFDLTVVAISLPSMLDFMHMIRLETSPLFGMCALRSAQ